METGFADHYGTMLKKQQRPTAAPPVEKASATDEAEPPETPGPQSRADTLPPTNQVASLDDDEAMRDCNSATKSCKATRDSRP